MEIRNITEDDLDLIVDLYKASKTKDELRWVYSDPENRSNMNAYVAFDDSKQLVGVVGYVLSEYCWHGNKYKGVISMTWMVTPKYRGLLGIQLLKKALIQGDFSFTLQGSEEAQKLYKAFNLNFIGYTYTYFKLLKPIAYCQSWKKPLPRRVFYMLRLLPTYFKNLTINYNEGISILQTDQFPKYTESDNYLRKTITKGYFNWLLDCPVNETYGFHILKEETIIGIAVCYIHTGNKQHKRGRIIHISTMEKENYYLIIIEKLKNFLYSKQCNSVTIVANPPIYRNALIRHGFIGIRSKRKPYYINNRKANIPRDALENWNIQYTEGDKLYRTI